MNIDKGSWADDSSQSNLSPHGTVFFSYRGLNHADFGERIRTVYTYILEKY